ncbi:MAG: iron-sulfur cluster insertion protein ErpA [Actinomycetota bacterium]|jgi:iron-sulfur cluster assembly protein/iron-sulfur cluster insertion protein
MQPISITTRKADPMVTLTDAAAAKVAQLIEAEGDTSLMLRVGVRPGGCSGFSYEMFFDTERNDDDIISEFGGVSVAVDAESMTMLDGAEIDYKDGLQGAGFAINNPNVSRACGCGNSFS